MNFRKEGSAAVQNLLSSHVQYTVDLIDDGGTFVCALHYWEDYCKSLEYEEAEGNECSGDVGDSNSDSNYDMDRMNCLLTRCSVVCGFQQCVMFKYSIRSVFEVWGQLLCSSGWCAGT